MGEWHTGLKAETREANVKKIVEHLEKYIPPQGVQSSILRFSRNFEEHCWKTAHSLHDYNHEIEEEMASIEKHEQLCEENPFTDRKYKGFLGAIILTYTSKTVAAPAGQIQHDPEDLTLEQSARTSLRRNSTLKETVRRLLLEKAVKKGNAGSALLNAMKAAQLQKQTSEREQTSPHGTQPQGSPNAPEQAHALNLFQKKNKNPGLNLGLLARK